MWGLQGSSLPGMYSAEKQLHGGHSQAHSCRTLPAQGKTHPCCVLYVYHAGFLGAVDILWKEQVQSTH
jgi:hypothetical protein